MDYIIKNENITLTVASKGAEIRSLKSGDREYMWNADPTFWARTAPVLFPLVGSLKGKEFTSHGKTYKMGQHGFARDTEFQLTQKTEDSITFTLDSSAETLEKYPYEFSLSISYKLEGRNVITSWRVTNPGSETLSFSIGGHPAFLCETEGYSFHIYEEEKSEGFKYNLLTSDGIVDPKTYEMKLEEGLLPIQQSLFVNDALIIPDTKIKKVALADKSGTEYLTVSFDAPALGLWSPAGKKAPFVCIEPWYGTADWADTADGIWEHRRFANTIEPGQVFEKNFIITI